MFLFFCILVVIFLQEKTALAPSSQGYTAWFNGEYTEYLPNTRKPGEKPEPSAEANIDGKNDNMDKENNTDTNNGFEEENNTDESDNNNANNNNNNTDNNNNNDNNDDEEDDSSKKN